MFHIIKKNKFKIIIIFLIILISSLISYYFGALSFHYKFFPFNSKTKFVDEKIIYSSSAKNNFIIKEYNLPVYKKYGAIEVFKNKIFYIDNDGYFYVFNEMGNNSSFKKLNLPLIQNNKEYFIAKHEKELGTVRLENLFGVRDIIIDNFSGKKKIFLSSLDYDRINDCFFMSIFSSSIESENYDILNISGWKKIFSSKPCLKTDVTPNELFAASSSGGRLSKLDENTILFTLGDFFADGVNGPLLSQDLDKDYGKIIEININNNLKSYFSIGHRNPQGLFVDSKELIFATEHGPEGGDELNRIIKNKNYGWPIKTFGTDYNKKFWPLSTEKYNSYKENSFENPIMSWGPNLGISNLIVYKSDYFHDWKENIIVTSLIGQKLIRLIYDKMTDKIIYLENIFIGSRIRDIAEDSEGKIILLTDILDANQFGEIPKLIVLEKYQ